MVNKANIEIRNINGKDVFIGNIAENFWLLNDVYVCLDPTYVITDEKILDWLDSRNELICPYSGSENDAFLYIMKEKNGSRYMENEYL